MSRDKVFLLLLSGAKLCLWGYIQRLFTGCLPSVHLVHCLDYGDVT